jgi:hypothetical protein
MLDIQVIELAYVPIHRWKDKKSKCWQTGWRGRATACKCEALSSNPSAMKRTKWVLYIYMYVLFNHKEKENLVIWRKMQKKIWIELQITMLYKISQAQNTNDSCFLSYVELNVEGSWKLKGTMRNTDGGRSGRRRGHKS